MDQQSATAADAGATCTAPTASRCARSARAQPEGHDASSPAGNRPVGIAGVSGSGKSSLALGVLYAEGSRAALKRSPPTRAAA